MSKGRHRKTPQYKHRRTTGFDHFKRLGSVAAGVMLAVLAIYAVPTPAAEADTTTPYVQVYP